MKNWALRAVRTLSAAAVAALALTAMPVLAQVNEDPIIPLSDPMAPFLESVRLPDLWVRRPNSARWSGLHSMK